MTPHCTRLPGQQTQRNLAGFQARLGILIIESKKEKGRSRRKPRKALHDAAKPDAAVQFEERRLSFCLYQSLGLRGFLPKRPFSIACSLPAYCLLATACI
jgi:hypothetical protein